MVHANGPSKENTYVYLLLAQILRSHDLLSPKSENKQLVTNPSLPSPNTTNNEVLSLMYHTLYVVFMALCLTVFM